MKSPIFFYNFVVNYLGSNNQHYNQHYVFKQKQNKLHPIAQAKEV